MLKLLKWAVIGCIGLVAVDAATDGDLAREVKRQVREFEARHQPKTLGQSLAQARRLVESSDAAVRTSHRQYLDAVAELKAVERDIAKLEVDQRQLLQTAKYLEGRLGTDEVVFHESFATLSRNEMQAQLKRKWSQLEWNEQILTEKRELKSLHTQKVEELAKRHQDFTERQRELRLRLIRLETRLDKLKQHPQWNMPECEMTDLEKAEDLAQKIEQEIEVRAQELEYGLQVLPEHATLPGTSLQRREEIERKYEGAGTDA